MSTCFVLDRPDDACGLGLAVQGEEVVHRGHDEVQAAEHVVREIERPVLEDVDLAAREHADAVLPGGVERRDVRELLPQPGLVEAAGLEAGLRMVGDAEVFPAVGFGRGRHLVERVVAVGFRGVVVEDAAQVGELHELRELARLGGVDLPVAFAEFRRNPRQAERAEDLFFAGRAGSRVSSRRRT